MYLSQKALPEAAMSFEKYIKVLEVIYDVKPGQLTPETFSKSNRSKEMTVITSVYWDLIRIYDASPRYRDRMSKSVDKLLMFAKYSTIFPAIVKKAEAFSRGCKNKDEVKRLIKSSRSGRSCFIATAVYGHEDHPKIDILRQFRDQVLQKTPPGRSFIKFYYQYSPSLSRKIQRHPVLKKILRPPLDQITLFAAKSLEKKHQKIDV